MASNSPDGAAIIDLYCDRFDDFTMPVTINNNLTGATFESEIRLAPDTPGAPLATIAISTPAVVGSVTTFTMSLPQGDVEDLPAGDEPGDDRELAWDLKMIMGGQRRTLFRGKFTVIAGVTQP